jgi:hypothetical protein
MQLSFGSLPWSEECKELEEAPKPKLVLEKIKKKKQNLNPEE